MSVASRNEIDASHSELNLRMDQGDPIKFNFLVKDASSWSTSSFTCKVKAAPGEPDVCAPTVVVTAVGADLDVLITNASVALLTAADSPFVWGMKETSGVTRFAGFLFVEPETV